MRVERERERKKPLCVQGGLENGHSRGQTHAHQTPKTRMRSQERTRREKG